MKKFVIFLIIFLLLPLAGAEKINGLDVEWESGTEYTLSWTNPQITKGDYVIKVVDFNWKGDVVVSATRKGETQNGILSQGENTVFDFTKNTTYFQGVKIYAKKVSNFYPLPTNIGTYPCCPAAEVTISVTKAIRKEPKLEITLSPNWDGRSGVPSTMKIKVANTGEGDFYDGNLTVNISGLSIADEHELSYQALTYNPLKGMVTRGWSVPLLTNRSYNVTLSVKSVLPYNRTTFTITAESYFRDYTGKSYSAKAVKTVSMNPTLDVNKRISPSTIFRERTYSSSEVDTGFLTKFFGLQAVTVVNLRVKNVQSYPAKAITLTDTLLKDFRLINGSASPGKDFKLVDNSTLQWVFDLDAGETKEFRYELSAQKTGSFITLPATAQWNGKTFSSGQPETRVYGVFVVVSKKTDKASLKPEDELNVTLSLENIGDFPVGINMTDILPENATFISGTTAFSGFLRPKESVSLKYNVSADFTGELEFPQPEVTFWKKEYEGSYGVIPAPNVPVLEPSSMPANVTNASQTSIAPAPAETPLPKSLIEIIDEKAPWLEGAVPVIMLLIAIILMLMLHVVNR